jgi:hypothetical protein
MQGGRRSRNRGGEGRWLGHILNITNGINDEMILPVNPSAILSV